ncbi:DUF4440 domain-containing protein [Nordella sp. HKS 07]|uniref:DUF4440 domain-containing protein n=1 Tax=Nordella sp. HKS 07 TaxID=2712222 RepID=UPI0013E16B21|nr:DUF4440 domain-containing protein [Nordella sp. HKS 07]QIG48491.1 DUF4440 domain-containing protein [Nordella sp. HKS 07]
MTPLAQAAAREVVELHAFFVEAFTGRDRDFSRAELALAPDMLMVTPEGRRVTRTQIMAGLVNAKARADFRITISDIRPVSETEQGVLLQYVEEQYRDGETSQRVSVALFEAVPGAPCGVLWHYLQETWIAD